jgi:protein required for attachment to host cells
MMIPHMAHVALVDGERFVLMRNVGQIFAPELEELAKPGLTKTNYSAGVRHQDRVPEGFVPTTTDLDELAHGAAAAEWLNERALTGEIEQLVVVADPRTLGEMRRHYHKALQARIVAELPKELSGESPQAVAAALAAA